MEAYYGATPPCLRSHNSCQRSVAGSVESCPVYYSAAGSSERRRWQWRVHPYREWRGLRAERGGVLERINSIYDRFVRGYRAGSNHGGGCCQGWHWLGNSSESRWGILECSLSSNPSFSTGAGFPRNGFSDFRPWAGRSR